MKALPFILLLVLVGCNRSGQEVMLAQTSAQVRQWVPTGASLTTARQTMEQHQFSCTVTSFASLEQMQRVRPKEIGIWQEKVIRDHVIQAVTNVTYLECKQDHLVVLLQVVNGETMGIFSAQP
ncbi:MAG: hypothetical protein P4N60_09000 [Verrucomicrobiae bacterium]|nr:hypothetical protein [Verrucomicrobiae bacterium]